MQISDSAFLPGFNAVDLGEDIQGVSDSVKGKSISAQ